MGDALISAQVEPGQSYRLSASDGSLSVDIPSGAVTEPGLLTVGYATGSLSAWPPGWDYAGAVYRFSGVTQFAEPVQVHVRYHRQALNGLNESGLGLYGAADDAWLPLPSRIDAGGQTVSADADRLGVLALLIQTAPITVTPALTLTVTPTSTVEVTATATLTITPALTVTPTLTPTLVKPIVRLWQGGIHNEAELSGRDTPLHVASADVLIESADPLITKRVDPRFAYVGDKVTFTIVVRNPGSAPATNAIITDHFERFLDIVSVQATQGTVQFNAHTRWVTATLGTLAPDASATIVIRAVVNNQVRPPQTLKNTAILDYAQSAVRISSAEIKLQVLEEQAGIPEPSTLALMGTGLVGLAGWAWRQRRRKRAA